MLLLVGLGNPGQEFEGTRHNIGFAALDLLAGRHGASLNRRRFSSRVGRGRVGGADVMLAKPETFMNLSGRAVKEIVDYLRLGLDDLLVLHDDMDVDLGRIKVSARGGSGGHQGVASIIESLGGDGFARIKIGIGRPPAEQTAESYVLSRFSPEEDGLMKDMVKSATDAAEVFVSRGAAAAQERFNRKDFNI